MSFILSLIICYRCVCNVHGNGVYTLQIDFRFWFNYRHHLIVFIILLFDLEPNYPAAWFQMQIKIVNAIQFWALPKSVNRWNDWNDYFRFLDFLNKACATRSLDFLTLMDTFHDVSFYGNLGWLPMNLLLENQQMKLW